VLKLNRFNGVEPKTLVKATHAWIVTLLILMYIPERLKALSLCRCWWI